MKEIIKYIPVGKNPQRLAHHVDGVYSTEYLGESFITDGIYYEIVGQIEICFNSEGIPISVKLV